MNNLNGCTQAAWKRGRKSRAERPQDLQAMRIAVGIYLTSREVSARDLAFAFLPSGEADWERNGADLIIWMRDRAHIISLLVGKEPMGRFREHFHDSLRALRQDTHVIRAETAAHAVEQVAAIVDGRGGFT